jgi:hypothetical protein
VDSPPRAGRPARRQSAAGGPAERPGANAREMSARGGASGAKVAAAAAIWAARQRRGSAACAHLDGAHVVVQRRVAGAALRRGGRRVRTRPVRRGRGATLTRKPSPPVAEENVVRRVRRDSSGELSAGLLVVARGEGGVSCGLGRRSRLTLLLRDGGLWGKRASDETQARYWAARARRLQRRPAPARALRGRAGRGAWAPDRRRGCGGCSHAPPHGAPLRDAPAAGCRARRVCACLSGAAARPQARRGRARGRWVARRARGERRRARSTQPPTHRRLLLASALLGSHCE